jgi:septal ring factor EnvC (AmiA/AmiB activator)
MKRTSCLLLAWALWGTPALMAQDAATEERLNRLSGQIEDLIAGQKAQQKRISELAREIESLRDQSARPNASYASQDDLRRVAKAVEEVDRKRIDDFEKVRSDLLNLAKSINKTLATGKKAAVTSSVPATDPATPTRPEKGFEYVVKEGDTLSTIVQAYRDQNVKVTVDQVLKANPGLEPKRLVVGKTIFIPAPKQ